MTASGVAATSSASAAETSSASAAETSSAGGAFNLAMGNPLLLDASINNRGCDGSLELFFRHFAISRADPDRQIIHKQRTDQRKKRVADVFHGPCNASAVHQHRALVEHLLCAACVIARGSHPVYIVHDGIAVGGSDGI